MNTFVSINTLWVNGEEVFVNNTLKIVKGIKRGKIISVKDPNQLIGDNYCDIIKNWIRLIKSGFIFKDIDRWFYDKWKPVCPANCSSKETAKECWNKTKQYFNIEI
jgi:hypothetical protein